MLLKKTKKKQFFALNTKTHLHFSLSCLSGGSAIPRESLMAEGNASSSAGRPAAPVSPLAASCAFAASSGLQPPHAHPASSASQPHPSSLPLPDRVGQTPERPSNADPQVEQLVGQPLPMFPSTLIPPLLLPTPPFVNPAPLGSFLQQATPHCSSSVSEATCKSPVPEEEQVKEEALTDCDKPVMSNTISINVTEKDLEPSASVATEYNDGKESAASVETVEPSKQKVVNDWDREELIVMEPPQESISRDSSTAGTLQNEER